MGQGHYFAALAPIIFLFMTGAGIYFLYSIDKSLKRLVDILKKNKAAES